MYDLKVSSKVANFNKILTESAINRYNDSIKEDNTPKHNDNSYANTIMESVMQRESVSNRYHSFIETVKSCLVTESIYKIMKESVDESIDNTSKSIMRAMVSHYVHENGYDNIMNKMKYGSVTTSCIYNTINESYKKILESVDKNDPNTFTITNDMKDEFFKQLDYSDSEAISDAIKDRVADAMNDFVTANNKDHQDVTDALNAAKEKITANPDMDEAVKESYTAMAKRKACDIRNAPKGVFHSMVSSMCESVIKHKEMHDEFMSEGKLDMDKIVSRTKLMYTFMETLNTSRLDTINEEFIEGIIKDLRA